MFKMIEFEQVATLIVKDMSHLGRNYIEVGQLTETILPMHDVRLIAVNDGVDSDKGEDDFTPFRNIMNEWYAKDMSCKMRSTLKIKNSQGYAIGRPPLGYVYDEMDKKRWVVDEEGAQIIEKIYNLRKQGESTVKIAKLLKYEKILIPSMPHSYAQSERSAEKQKEELRAILDRLQKANINTILLQTRIRATTIYPSQYEPWDGCLSGFPGKSPGSRKLIRKTANLTTNFLRNLLVKF